MNDLFVQLTHSRLTEKEQIESVCVSNMFALSFQEYSD